MKRIERFDLDTLAQWCGGVSTSNAVVSGVSTDSRSVAASELFVALKGPSFDGHLFVGTAEMAGASALLVSDEVVSTLPQIRVDDTLKALQMIAHRLFLELTRSGVQSVAITGSNGKTTTKELVAALVASAGKKVHATPGNLNNHIGVPLTICGAADDIEVLVVEMGCNQFGDIRELIQMAPCEVRILTSIGYAHVERLGDLDGVRRAKSEIFEVSSAKTVAVVPFDERQRLGLKNFQGSIYSSGFARASDLAVKAQPDANGQDTDLRDDDMVRHVRLNLAGPHNALNLGLAWLAVEKGLHLMLNEGQVNRQLALLALPGGRLKRISRAGWEFIDDAYNSNPTSARASHDAFLEMTGPTPRIAVFGEMLELGPGSEKLHADLARSVAMRGGVDALVFVGTHAQTMSDAANDAGASAEIYAVPDVETAASVVKSLGPAFVFIKASRGVRLERLIDRICPEI
jgi:UDP-N-acetylmuramoyl-tripeptide--D-alanyl-D-alanine ligase